MTLGSLLKYQICGQLLESCPFSTAPKDCTDKFCNGIGEGFNTCQDDFPVPGACCSNPNPASCLTNYQLTMSNKTETGACNSVRSELLECNSISGFATLAPTDQASCLCYNKASSYIPSSWDNAAKSCYSSGSSAHPILYSILIESSSEALGFCTKFAGPATATASATATAKATGTATGSTITASATQGSVAASASGTPTGSSSATASTTKASGSSKAQHMNAKFLFLGLALVLPSILMTAL